MYCFFSPLIGKLKPALFPFIIKQRLHLIKLITRYYNDIIHLLVGGGAAVVDDLVHEEPHVAQLLI